MTSPEPPVPDDQRTPPPPTFAGRLKLEDFKFDGNGSASASPSPGGIRRSARLSSTIKATPVITDTSSSSASPSRKATQTQTTVTTTLTTTTTKAQSSKRKLITHTSTSTTPTPSSSSSSTPTSKRPKSLPKKNKIYDNIPQTLPDALSPNLLVLFIGLNPGISTAIQQHAYAHPTNLFWRLLFSSGITPVLCAPSEDRSLPERFSLGLTNIVGRPTRNGGELTKGEMDEGVAVLEEKVRVWKPEAVCVVGKGIWESVYRVRERQRQQRHGQGQIGIEKDKVGLNKGRGKAVGLLPKDWKYGWQDESENMGVPGGDSGDEEEEMDTTTAGGGWKGARVFVATSTSGLAATVGRAEKERIWRELGEWVERRRTEREKEKGVKGEDEDEDQGQGGVVGE
ncbi:DNA glycosylase [Neurospora crassa]|uniref:G/U mismatch-specific DNA glycosylase n=1 Tax=Neurospora crassa (strain ATCC 24698 / 74-OR23-1A / CBS 708.71 / DSM 1257 / FGSC 987) TaxID=367110 RepID=Q7SDB2_NEUCR|nr:G/U mismatch-specific DNA glycosylase [Neurospora crassa OR74A]EAA34754.1 G/U mismatch-specific DNA glycosylase [Neurospora crassa OR74A]KHE80234.1 DNA glycosylase [Neurospora crassa]|eukprot:XP_963990.1 G/U mismatch-specific DNA glycosylase [Neurospora crassa OR74A]